MRYYRLWIYTCNATLLSSAAIFIVFLIWTFSHPYILLVPGPPANDPTYLYSYVAVFLQSGVVQALGCVGAKKLSQKFLYSYWIILVVLLLGDLAVATVWFMRLPRYIAQVNTTMSSTLQKYGENEDITYSWNKLQQSEKCCGIVSYEDYAMTLTGKRGLQLPDSCCFIGSTEKEQSSMLPSIQVVHVSRHIVFREEREKIERDLSDRKKYCSKKGYIPYPNGCEEHLREWMRSSTENLLILGFCVIGFLKLCFVGILKMEIQEMIEKIGVLQRERVTDDNPELAAVLGLDITAPQVEVVECNPENETSDRNIVGAQTFGNVIDNHTETQFTRNGTAPIGIRESSQEVGALSPKSAISPIPFQKSTVLSVGNLDPDHDSDTNSYSALITETPVHKVVNNRWSNNNHINEKNIHSENNNINLLTNVPLTAKPPLPIAYSPALPPGASIDSSLHGRVMRQTQI